jgi:hypothetical protein
VISYQIRRKVLAHFMERMGDKFCDLQIHQQSMIARQQMSVTGMNGKGIWSN